MPTRPPTLRPRGTPEGGRAGARREYDRERRRAHPWRRWYNTAAWRRRRAEQLAREPLCRMCLDEGRTTAATIADHREPHRGDWDKFIGGALDSLCKPHHDGKKQREERAAGGGSKVETPPPRRPAANTEKIGAELAEVFFRRRGFRRVRTVTGRPGRPGARASGGGDHEGQEA